MARPLTPREATEMILANRLRHGGSSSDPMQPARPEKRRANTAQQPRSTAAPGAQRAAKKE